MKSISTILLAIFLLAAPSLSFAHGDKIKTIKGISGLALDVFENDEPENIQKTFLGTKAWIDGSDLSVKVLLKNQAMIAYECEIEKWEHQNGQDVAVGSCTKNENP